jgi:hypothetical protein
MTNPTSNFGWQMPTSTDLVTDLPADFETFGQAVDTSLAELKGGTTGQVLSKTSNTDMDFTWVTSDDANAIQNTIVDAKGDLIAASASDVPARLAVGSNGDTLVADSSTSTGLRYTAGTVQANPVLNSAFQVWQRGTSIAGAGFKNYTADQWTLFRAGTTISRQVTNDTTNLPFIQYCARVQRDSGTTGTSVNLLQNTLETINSIPYAGKTVTYSFYARKGANYSNASDNLVSAIYSGTGTDQALIDGFTGSAIVVQGTATLTTTWQRFSYTGTVASNATELGVQFNFTPSGTAGANDYYEVTGVQLDIGNVALPFRTYAGTIQGELAACQRYYFRNTGANGNILSQIGTAGSTTTSVSFVTPPVTMRVTPTSIDYANVHILDTQSAYTLSALTISTSSTKSVFELSGTTTGLTITRPNFLAGNATGAFIGLSAEL